MSLNTTPSFSHPLFVSDLNMASSSTLPHFIGAVEDHWSLYSDRPSDYVIGSPIGFGASSIVYSATYQPPNSRPQPCALKVLDLDTLPLHSWALLQRETTLMSLSKHPNVLRVRGSWMDGHKLYIAFRLMNKGSAADVMRYGWPGGMEEEVIKSILEQALLGLNYLHVNSIIHRDVKAANLLIDDDGTVLLGDLGVAADLSEGSSHTLSSLSSSNNDDKMSPEPKAPQIIPLVPSNRVIVDPLPTPKRKIGKRKSFVGTPCWMAPELIQGKQYDSSADIWSFGITALELTQGRPPRSRESPQKVLLRTIQDDPPTLNRDGGTHKYSKVFAEMVESCLVKDPSKRPTAAQLLQMPFFRGTKKKSYLINSILKDLPPLTKRQERRVLPSSQIYRTVDSWDFTIHSVPVSPSLGTPTKRKSIERSVLHGLEGEIESSRRHSSHSRSSGKRHSSSTPTDSVHSTQIRAPEELDALVAEPIPEQKDEMATALSFSEKTMAPTLTEFMAADEMTRLSVSKPMPIPKSKPDSFQPSSFQDQAALSTSPMSVLSSSAASRSPPKDMASSSSPSRGGGLWHKIKGKTSSNVKRVTSLSGLGTSPRR
ncbi:hypothetical protein GYMLUDRAFT_33510 [Collybiopsis luxurians FD-317 M1]|nr:hypothetical protein GYMLUDRAFT_33510 [Collybiopsis luxurians FD-317 M1]